jgi:hypothetical protein
MMTILKQKDERTLKIYGVPCKKELRMFKEMNGNFSKKFIVVFKMF